ncbi:MAG: hypothetical protein R3321_10560 [Nitrososphaeraceae archaeon]|nr:hypothetical protein [Nitrososphaeraceae archaeon]
MLGNKLGELVGKISSQRVLDVTGNQKIEFNVSTSGTFRNIAVTELHTYVSVIGFDGIPYGQSNGIVMVKNGSESANFTGHAVGYNAGNGKMRYTGSIFFKASSLNGTLSFLNNVLAVFENDIDESNNSTIRLWEWR